MQKAAAVGPGAIGPGTSGPGASEDEAVGPGEVGRVASEAGAVGPGEVGRGASEAGAVGPGAFGAGGRGASGAGAVGPGAFGAGGRGAVGRGASGAGELGAVKLTAGVDLVCGDGDEGKRRKVCLRDRWGGVRCAVCGGCEWASCGVCSGRRCVGLIPSRIAPGKGKGSLAALFGQVDRLAKTVGAYAARSKRRTSFVVDQLFLNQLQELKAARTALAADLSENVNALVCARFFEVDPAFSAVLNTVHQQRALAPPTPSQPSSSQAPPSHPQPPTPLPVAASGDLSPPLWSGDRLLHGDLSGECDRFEQKAVSGAESGAVSGAGDDGCGGGRVRVAMTHPFMRAFGTRTSYAKHTSAQRECLLAIVSHPSFHPMAPARNGAHAPPLLHDISRCVNPLVLSKYISPRDGLLTIIAASVPGVIARVHTLNLHWMLTESSPVHVVAPANGDHHCSIPLLDFLCPPVNLPTHEPIVLDAIREAYGLDSNGIDFTSACKTCHKSLVQHQANFIRTLELEMASAARANPTTTKCSVARKCTTKLTAVQTHTQTHAQTHAREQDYRQGHVCDDNDHEGHAREEEGQVNFQVAPGLSPFYTPARVVSHLKQTHAALYGLVQNALRHCAQRDRLVVETVANVAACAAFERCYVVDVEHDAPAADLSDIIVSFLPRPTPIPERLNAPDSSRP